MSEPALESYLREVYWLLFTRADSSGAPIEDAQIRERLGPGRWYVYRRMLRSRMRDVTRAGLPRLCALAGDAIDGWIERWIEAEGPRSRFFRDVPGELVRWGVENALFDSLGPWANDLARFEDAIFAVPETFDPRASIAAADLAMDRPARLSAAHRVLNLSWGVHRISREAENDDGEVILPDVSNVERVDVSVCVYRGGDDELAKVIELSPLAAEIVARMSRGDVLAEAIRGAAHERRLEVDGPLIASVSTLLDDLMERGLLLGSEG
jgi:hypothetical protein